MKTSEIRNVARSPSMSRYVAVRRWERNSARRIAREAARQAACAGVRDGKRAGAVKGVNSLIRKARRAN